MGTKLEELRNGCFHRALDDEPMFVGLARDPSMPVLIRVWADSRELEIHQGKRPSSDLDQIAEARATADKMEAWREANDGKWREEQPRLAFIPVPPTEGVMRPNKYRCMRRDGEPCKCNLAYAELDRSCNHARPL